MSVKTKIEALSEHEQVKALKSQLNELTNQFNEKLGKLGVELKKYGVQGTEAASQVVEENPLKAVGVALACGLIIGLLMGRQ